MREFPSPAKFKNLCSLVLVFHFLLLCHLFCLSSAVQNADCHDDGDVFLIDGELAWKFFMDLDSAILVKPKDSAKAEYNKVLVQLHDKVADAAAKDAIGKLREGHTEKQSEWILPNLYVEFHARSFEHSGGSSEGANRKTIWEGGNKEAGENWPMLGLYKPSGEPSTKLLGNFYGCKRIARSTIPRPNAACPLPFEWWNFNTVHCSDLYGHRDEESEIRDEEWIKVAEGGGGGGGEQPYFFAALPIDENVWGDAPYPVENIHFSDIHKFSWAVVKPLKHLSKALLSVCTSPPRITLHLFHDKVVYHPPPPQPWHGPNDDLEWKIAQSAWAGLKKSIPTS